MAKTPESLQDFTESLMHFDMNKGAEQILDALAKVQVPGLDMPHLVASQRENVRALSIANRAAMEGIKGVGEWQMKILKQTMEEISNATSGMTKVQSPKEVVAEQTELAKHAFETAVNNMRELAGILEKANQDATQAIVERVPESLDEIKEVLKIKQQ